MFLVDQKDYFKADLSLFIGLKAGYLIAGSSRYADRGLTVRFGSCNLLC